MLLDQLNNELIVGSICLFVKNKKMCYGVLTDITLEDTVIIAGKECNPTEVIRLPHKVFENHKEYKNIIIKQKASLEII